MHSPLVPLHPARRQPDSCSHPINQHIQPVRRPVGDKSLDQLIDTAHQKSDRKSSEQQCCFFLYPPLQ